LDRSQQSLSRVAAKLPEFPEFLLKERKELREFYFMATLTILHTNDIHGQFDQMTRLASLIARERASAASEGRAVLLLDAGDSSDLSAWESRVTKGRANFAMLEAMGYDAVAIGNGDMQWGRDALAKLVGSVHFPALAANLLALDSDQPPTPGLRSHAIFEFGELKVAVIGVTVNEPGLYDDWGYRIESVETTARALVSRLRDASRGAQVVIVLSHEGVEADQ
jgi:2',3'-cyclic-nucleotide 2'-phosphodiesterase (5'-nucleotidase family)